MVKKTVFLLAWIGIFFMSILSMAYVIVPQYFIEIDITSFFFRVILFNISFIYLCITLLKLCSNFSKVEGYTIKNENGVVYITNDTVKNIVKGVIVKDEEVKEIKIKCGKSGKKYFVKLELEVLSNLNITNKITEIQEKIGTELDEKLGLKVDSIEVKIVKVSIN